ncbi:MAG: insulinase family protein [Candidatus Electrothrix sp. AR3]|nr:insulinase family protein [Candidatus Electrothrix sp. AR3]
MWLGGGGAAQITSEKSSAAKPESIILAAFKATQETTLKPWVQEEEKTFPYLPVPKIGTVVDRHIVYNKIDVDRYLFTNGLVLNLKKTNFEPNEIQIAVSLGHGQLSEPKPGLGLLAQMVLPESGLGGMTKEQLKVVLAPYTSRVHFRVNEDSFQFKGTGLTNETELLFQLLYSKLYDPAFRSDAFRRVRKKLEQMYAQLQGSVEGMMELQGEQFLAGGNQRYGSVQQEKLAKLTLKELQDWLAPILQHEGLEISVVGDFDQKEILRLVGTYFGDQRKARAQHPKGEQIIFPAGKNLTLKVDTASNKAQVTVAWPTDDFWDIARTRRLSVLASVLDDRLRKQIREDLGAAYSPYVYNHSSVVDPGYGVLRSVMVVDPPQAVALGNKLKQVGAQLASGKVTAEELERAIEPALTSIRDMVRTNRYWLESVLLHSGRHPQRLEWPQTIQPDFAAITAIELTNLAKQYLSAEKAAEVILLPQKKE